MDMIPRNDYGERCQFDAYCKLVLYHEAIDYLREMQRRRDRELSFSDLPQMEMDKLCVVDHYPSDRFTFSSHGYTELSELQAELPDKWEYYIDRLSGYIASTGRKYKNHAATIRRWVADDTAKAAPKRGIPDYSYKEGESL